MKNLLSTLFLGGALSLGISENINGQEIISTSQMDSVEKEIDNLLQSAVNNYNDGKIKYNKCAEDKSYYKHCADTLVNHLLNSKEALEKYDKMIQKNKEYELSYGTISIRRNLDSEETKEWIKNEDKLMQLIKNFLENPSIEKQKLWINQYIDTTKLLNSWFSE